MRELCSFVVMTFKLQTAKYYKTLDTKALLLTAICLPLAPLPSSDLWA